MMRRTWQRSDRGSAGRINMTPMIDITFLLLTFFLLAGHFAAAEKTADVELPRPDNNQGVDRRLQDKVIINLVRIEGRDEPEIRLAAMRLDSIEALQRRIETIAAQNPEAQVILRADRRLAYRQVRQVMELISGNGLQRLQIVTDLEASP